jgi:putative ABC transport system ATP-binding protein
VAAHVEFLPVGLSVPVLQAFELYRFYHSGSDEIVALRGVDLSLERGEFLALVGPSGSGKSTLLNCLAGLDEPDGGEVELVGQPLTRRPESVRARLRAQQLGLLMQSGNLFDHLTVWGNIELQMRLAGRKNRARIRELLHQLGLEARTDANPTRLSGGEAARAGLAVALAAEPQVLICDEPTAEVDAENERHVLDALVSLRGSGKSVLVATHSAAVAERADRVISIRDGRIVDA